MAHSDPHSSNVGHETRDVYLRPLAGGLIGLVVLLCGSLLLMWGLLAHLATNEARESPRPNPLAHSFGRQVPPEPRLQTDPRKDLLQMRAEEDAVLQTYGWVDRKAGVTRIPIERAMELLAQRQQVKAAR
jgi:hypothetical protein